MTKEIYVFSLSAEDPSFEPHNIERTVQWLNAKHENPYYFKEKRPKSLPSGSIVLFSFEAQIFGQATVKKGITDVPKEVQDNWDRTGKVVYKYQTVFEDGVEIFPKPFKRKDDLKDILLPKRKDFGQLFTPLSPNEYEEMIRRIRR